MSDNSPLGLERVVLVQCTKTKRDGEWPARLLYDTSDYFRKQRAYGETADAWFVQSAEYGLLAPDDVIESYDTHASNLDHPEEWARDIADALDESVDRDVTVEILGGKAYADPLTPELEKRGYEVHEPLRGERIGARKRSLAGMAVQSLERWA